VSEVAPDFSHVETWIFDLDDTLYPPSTEFMRLIEGRMTEFVMRQTRLGFEDARALQKRYLNEHGTTLAGLMAHHGVDPHAFVDEVHDVSLDRLTPDPALRAGLERLPGRRLVFTNGSAKHAERVLARLGVDDLFEDTFHLETANWVPKPQPSTYAAMVQAHGVEPRRAALFEDSPRNLKPAHVLGMTTVLVRPDAPDIEGDHIDWRVTDLAPFLAELTVAEPN
jgi:putative hydrolase of the HAD superfamily